MTCFIATEDAVFAKELQALAVLNGLTLVTESADLLLLDVDHPVKAPPCRKIVRFSYRAGALADYVRPFRYDMLIDFWKLTDSEDADETEGYHYLPMVRDFSPTEQRLLEMLMESDGEVMHATELSRRMFGDPARLNELKVYIRHLRQKIEDPLGIRIIETVRGVGYRFRGDRLSSQKIALFPKGKDKDKWKQTDMA